MENEKFTRLTVERINKIYPEHNIKVSWEVPYDDVDSTDLIKALRCLMDGLTFFPEHFNSQLAAYLEEYASDQYDIIDKTESKTGLYENEKEAIDEAIPHFTFSNYSFGDLIFPNMDYEAKLLEDGNVMIKKIDKND